MQNRPRWEREDRDSRIDRNRQSKRLVFRRSLFLMLVCGVGLFIPLVIQLWTISIRDHDFYQQRATDQQLMDVSVSAHRGDILDANGDVLAMSATVYNLILAPKDLMNSVDQSDYTDEEGNEDEEAWSAAVQELRDEIIDGLMAIRPDLDRADLDLARVLLPQRQLIAPQGHLQGVPQGGDFGDLHHRPRRQTHVHQPPLHRARLVAHGYNHAALPGRELLESAGLGFFGVIHSKRCSDPNVSSAPFRSILPERR